MCVIIYKPAGKQMPDDFTLYQCYRRNPDGIGFATPNQVFKTLDFGEAYTALQNVSVDEPCIIHFRWATHGSVKIANCHPFTSPNGAIKFAHNGVLPFESVNDKTDSEIAFKKVILPAIEQYGIGSRKTKRIINNLAGASRFAIMVGDKVSLFGTWARQNGLYFSNLYWQYSQFKLR